jgi:Ni/Fe-hydrogenase subunit HybB-like protein
MLIETWIAALIIVCVFIGAIISGFGWIIEGERLAKAEKENKKLIAENGRLYKIISHMNGIHNVEVADAFYHKEDKENV